MIRLLLWLLIPLFLCGATSAPVNFQINITASGAEAVFDHNGAPWSFFNQVPAINYDTGGQNVGYNVPMPGCQGTTCVSGASTYRADDVNFKASTFAGIAYQLGYSAIPNSYNYQINISQVGPYNISLWLGDTSTGGSWGVLIDGTPVTTVATPNTGNFGIFQQATSGNFTVATGNHKLTLICNAGDLSFNGCGDIVAWRGALSTGGGIACDIGTNYTGSIPAGAQAAGFTHCAAHYDFTSAQYSNLSTWLDVCGAGSPQWWVTSSDGAGNPAPCGAWSITTDGGSQVLQMHWEPGYLNSNILTTGMQTRSGGGAVQDFPEGSYFQATYRSSVGSFGNPEGGNSPFVSAWWSWQAASAVWEVDFLETYAFSSATGKGLCGSTVVCGAGTNTHDWGGSGGSISVANYESSGGSGYDPVIYQTIGTRITNDGSSNVAVCSYLNGGFLSCGSGSFSIPSMYSNRSFLIMYDGPQANDGYMPNVAQDIFVKDIVVFSCANWQSGQCLNNPVLTTAP